MINPDITLIIQMINFLILLFLLNFILFRPIRTIMKERNQIIQNFNSDITSLTEEAEDSMERFEHKVLEAKKEGMAEIHKRKGEGEQAEAELIAATNAEVQAKIQEARIQLQAQVQAFSVAVTEKVLGRSVQ